MGGNYVFQYFVRSKYTSSPFTKSQPNSITEESLLSTEKINLKSNLNAS